MSSSNNKLKRKTSEGYEELMENMSLEFPNTLEGFHYKFNQDGQLHHMETGEKFTFQVSEDHSHNQKHYEALGEVITEHIYVLLQSQDVGLKKLEIPLQAKEKNAKGFIFVSENYEIAEGLLVLVHGSGVVRAGQWARRLIINDCLDHGTQIPYIKQGLKRNYGIVVLNTNQHQGYNVKGKKKDIKDSETPERHFSYVWKHIVEKATAKKIFVVAHSYGGFLVVDYFMKNPDAIDKLVAVAFTDSVHNLNYQTSGNVQAWFAKNSVNWVTSFEDLDTPMFSQNSKQFNLRVSAGTTMHEETSWKAMESIFSYFSNHEMELYSKPGDCKEEKRDSHVGVESSNNVEGPKQSGSQNKPTFLNLATQNENLSRNKDAHNHSGTCDGTTSQDGTNSGKIDKCTGSQGGTIDSAGACTGSVSGIGADKSVNDNKSSDGEIPVDGDNICDGSQIGTNIRVGASACSTSGTSANISDKSKHRNIGTNGENNSDGSQGDTSDNDDGGDVSACSPSGPDDDSCSISLNQAKLDGKFSDSNPDENMSGNKGNNYGKISSEGTSGKMVNEKDHICGEIKDDPEDGHTSSDSPDTRTNDSKDGASILGECMGGPAGKTNYKTATNQEEKNESKIPPEHEYMQVEETVALTSENHEEKSKL